MGPFPFPQAPKNAQHFLGGSPERGPAGSPGGMGLSYDIGMPVWCGGGFYDFV